MTKLLREPAITLDNSGAALDKYQGLHVSGLFPLPEIKMVSPLWFVTEILRNFHDYIKVQPSSKSMLYILGISSPHFFTFHHIFTEKGKIFAVQVDLSCGCKTTLSLVW